MVVMNRLSSYKKPTAEEDYLPGYETSSKSNTTVEELHIQVNSGSQVVNNINLVSSKVSQILNLRSDKYQLVSPLPVTISLEDNLYLVTAYDLNLFGYGESEDEAIQDLCEAIVEYCDELENNKDCLGKITSHDKHFLDQIIKKCN